MDYLKPTYVAGKGGYTGHGKQSSIPHINEHSSDEIKRKEYMRYPSVTVITPTTLDRVDMNNRLIEMVCHQDYEGTIQHSMITYNKCSLGYKRNSLCNDANGMIIIHMDSDDIYAPDWITKSVEHLINTKADITGLSNAYFYNGSMLEYKYNGGQPYVLGATMCYWKHVWEKQPFRDVQTSEDLYFQMNRVVIPHFYKHSFLATLHGNNTASHKNMSIYKPVDINPSEIYPFVEF